jgi:hypothetical protein
VFFHDALSQPARIVKSDRAEMFLASLVPRSPASGPKISGAQQSIIYASQISFTVEAGERFFNRNKRERFYGDQVTMLSCASSFLC